MAEWGLNTGLAVNLGFDDRINDLRVNEELTKRIQAENAAKVKLFSDDTDFKNATNPFDNKLIKEKMQKKVRDIGQFVTENPDYNTNINKMALYREKLRGLKDDPDLIRGMAVDEQYKEYLKDMQEVAKDPRRHNLVAYDNIGKSFKSYFDSGNKSGDPTKGIDPPTYSKPRDFIDLAGDAQKLGSQYENNPETFDMVDWKNGNDGAYKMIPKASVVEKLAQDHYINNKDQYDIEYGAQALDKAKNFVLSSIKGEVYHGTPKDTFYAHEDYRARKALALAKASQSPQADIYTDLVVNSKDVPVDDSALFQETFGLKPTVMFKGPNGKMIQEDGNEFNYTRLRDAEGKPKGIKDASGYIIKPLKYGLDNEIVRKSGFFDKTKEPYIVNPEFADVYTVVYPNPGQDGDAEPVLNIKANAFVNSNSGAAKSKYNARIKTTADYKNATGYNGSLVNEGVEMKTDKKTGKTYRKVTGGWEEVD